MVEPVPELLRGAWRRTSIVSADGTSDTSSFVLWIQLESSMVDVRVPAEVAALAGRRGFDACALAELRLLAASEASTGYTSCTPIGTDDDGRRRATAVWHTRGPGELALHPVSPYPEPGLLSWDETDGVMTERAPSGAYVEEWHRVPGTTDRLVHRRFEDGSQLFVAGGLAVLAHDRRRVELSAEPLDRALAAAGEDREAIVALVDAEFSVAARSPSGDTWQVIASTLPWRTGGTLDVDL